MTPEHHVSEVLSTIEVGDSKFMGFVKQVPTKAEAIAFQASLKERYNDAAHVVIGFVVPEWKEGFDEDDEPQNSAGPHIVNEVKLWSQKEGGVAVVIVRYFGSQLLGVTCGRLGQCYARVAKQALHRFFNPGKPMEQVFSQVDGPLYGLAAGDTELILNIVSDPDLKLLERLQDELKFDGFQGAAGETLPRLQNLQASVAAGTIPVYRYPGNYHGDEWETFEWKPISLKIKHAVEQSLLPLVEQEMNHCVTNFYRANTNDFIAHHSDKDLDLNRDGVIVSVSLGDERILELRKRAEPQDITRITLPHCSMLVLGPKTNQLYTHSILKKEGSTKPRISLTMRDVKTFMDLRTGRLYGQGVVTKSVDEIRRTSLMENSMAFLGFCALSTILSAKKTTAKTGLVAVGACTAATLALRLLQQSAHKRREVKAARDFFSKTSTSGTKY